MKQTIINYKAKLSTLSKEEARMLLAKLSFDLAYKTLVKNPDKLNETLNDFIYLAKDSGLDSNEDIKIITQAIMKASIEEEKTKLFKLISDQDELQAAILRQKESIKDLIRNNFSLLEANLASQGLASEVLKDAKLCDIEILGLLKETAESAYLTTLEKGCDIELTAKEITRSLVCSAIDEGVFEKKRIIKITSVVLQAAFEIANETKLYANALCMGAILGAWEGIFERASFLKETLPFCEEKPNLSEKELIYLEDDFIFLLRFLQKNAQSPVKELLQEILDTQLDNISAKFSRILQEGKENLKLKLNDLKQSPKVAQLEGKARERLAELKEDFYRFDAKELGTRLWERAKNLIKK